MATGIGIGISFNGGVIKVTTLRITDVGFQEFAYWKPKLN